MASDELAEYFRLTSVPEPFEVVDLLQWWYSRRLQFPQLYRLARNVLCIPGIFSSLLFAITLVNRVIYFIRSAVAVE
jgi:hypothetical protein